MPTTPGSFIQIGTTPLANQVKNCLRSIFANTGTLQMIWNQMQGMVDNAQAPSNWGGICAMFGLDPTDTDTAKAFWNYFSNANVLLTNSAFVGLNMIG